MNRPDPYAQREQDNADSEYLRGQEINQQGAAQRDRNRLATSEQNAQNQYRQQALAQSSDQFQQEQDLRTREQDLRENQFADQEAATAPNTIVDAYGRQFTGNRQQGIDISNLGKMVDPNDPDSVQRYEEGLAKTLGQPYMNPTQKATADAKDAQLKLQQDKQQAQSAQAAAALAETQRQHDLLDDQHYRHELLVKSGADAKTVADSAKRTVGMEDAAQASAEKTAAAAVSLAAGKLQATQEAIARRQRELSSQTSGPDLLKDGMYAQLAETAGQQREQLNAARAAHLAIVENGAKMKKDRLATPPANAPGRKTTSETPTQGAPTPQRGGKAGQATQYTATATGPDGRKIGYNPITKAWEPIQP